MVTSATDNLQANQRNRPEQPENAYLANGTLPNELLLKIGAYVTAPKDKVALVKTCFSLHLFFSKQEQLDLKKLLFAIINDDRKTVLTLLDNNPSLLMKKPIENTIIKNKRTWQKFYAENPLTMAVKLKQIKMIEILLPYYEKLPQTRDVINAKVTALSTWKFYEMQNVGGEDEIVIPKEYEALAQSLIEAFKEEDFPNGVPDAENIVPYEKGKVPYNVILSEKTELALTSLLNILVPKNAVKLDEHVDSELFLLAIYKAYRNNVSYFSNDGGKDALCIRGMGLNHTALIPETGKIFCEGFQGVLSDIYNKKEEKIGVEAQACNMKGNHAFYRVSRNSRSGSGFDFLCGMLGLPTNKAAAWHAGVDGIGGVFWEMYVVEKQKKFSELLRINSPAANPSPSR